MAKTIKFNLVLDGNPVRTIEELKENFNIDDILWAYQNQNTLERWLAVRGYTKELEKIKQIRSIGKMDICRELISIFDVEKDDDEIKLSLYHIEVSDQKENRLLKINNHGAELNKIINKYHEDYMRLKDDMQSKCDDYSFLKVSISRIESEFIELFKIDYKNCFSLFVSKAPLAILAILSNSNLGQYFLADAEICKELINITSLTSPKSFIKKSKTQEYAYLSKYLRCYESKTQYDWENVEPSNKRCMIIALGIGCSIKNIDRPEEELKASDVKIKFPILDGFDYKSRRNSAESIAVFYMEV